ncbi:MAG TPA: phosphate ABC transporter substrate-binding protein PstS [Candidatus Binatia bacterium]|nr:phosphate ABC transporter substrate-binding protein PstS [Candidatus Binatia bacterium]
MTSHKNSTGAFFRWLALAVLVLSLAGACGRSQSDAEAKLPAGTTLLTGAGATFPSVLYNRWFAVYQGSHPNVVVRYAAVGSGEGVRRFIGKNISEKEKIDFGASDAAMSDAEIANAGGDALMIPMTAGCVVLAYDLPGLQGDLKLSRRAYSGIFLGEIKRWDDELIAEANPDLDLPAISITTAVRQDGSGTTFAFTKHLDAVSDKWRGRFGPATLVNWPGNAMRAKGNEGVAGLIGNSVGAIGYVGYEFAQRLGLKTAALENKDGKFVKPSERACGAALAAAELPENLRAFVPDPSGANSYPIVTFSWILVRKRYPSAETANALRDFFRWSLEDGQRYAAELGYVPIPPSVAAKGRAALEAIQSGGGQTS